VEEVCSLSFALEDKVGRLLAQVWGLRFEIHTRCSRTEMGEAMKVEIEVIFAVVAKGASIETRIIRA
jgi:hypothetical protein